LDDEDLRYVYGIGRIAQVGASTHYYLSDGLGSTMALTDEDGDVINDYDYDVFGTVRVSTGTQTNVFKFTGEQLDGSTGLQYLRARYYDTANGRFIGRDPLSGVVGLPISQNRYSYVLDNPTNLLDPSGLCVDPLPCPKPLQRAGEAASNLYHERKAAVQGQFSRDTRDIKNAIREHAAPALTQCVIWGIQGGVASRNGAGVAAGCAAGSGAYVLGEILGANPISECFAWGAAGRLGGDFATTAIGCGAGVASYYLPNDPGVQCAAWGVSGVLTGQILKHPIRRGISSCIAGALSTPPPRAHASGKE
jgi:RHS repeat-associated protein